jgi:hypothetical protein
MEHYRLCLVSYEILQPIIQKQCHYNKKQDSLMYAVCTLNKRLTYVAGFDEIPSLISEVC